MKHRFIQFTLSLSAALAATFALTSCREDTIIKASLTPAIDNINTFGIGPDFNNGTDNFVVLRTKTVYEDSVITSARQTGFPIYHAIGSVNDPYAGTSVAGVFMQVVPTATNFKFPADQVLDSVVLAIPYTGFTWGDTTSGTTQKVNVYTISEGFSKDSTFYNFSNRAVNTAPVGTASFNTGRAGTGSIVDSVLVGSRKRAPHLRIRLDASVNSTVAAAVAADATFAGFTDILKGFYIAPDTAAGFGRSLPYFRLSGSLDYYAAASMIAHTHSTTTGKDSTFLFPYNEAQAAHFNRITRNYYSPLTEAGKWLRSTAIEDSVVVMQNAPGASVDLVLPNIADLPKNVIINKAEIVFTKISSIDDGIFLGPARLLPIGVNSTGGRYSIADRYPITDASLDFIDGTPRSAVRGGNTVTQYRINIPRELQRAMVQGSNNLHLRIGGTVNFPAAYRLVLGGSGMVNTIYKPSMNIIYSKQ